MAAVAISLCVGLVLPAIAVTSEEVIKLVEKAKIISPELKLQAAINGPEVDLSTYRNPKATDRDCKIDAVLMAKEIMTAYPAIVRVKVLFYDATNPNKYREVMIRQGDVKAFAGRQLTPDQLMASIEIISGELRNPIADLRNKPYSQIAGAPPFVDGPHKGERIEAYGRIEKLKSRGVGVAPFMAIYMQMEDRARQGDEQEVVKALNYLNERLNAQEDSTRASRQQAMLPRAVQPAAPVTPGAVGTIGHMIQNARATAGVLTPRVQEAQRELGDIFAPLEGAFWPARYQIGAELRRLHVSGVRVDQYMLHWRQLQELASRGIPADAPLMRMQVRNLLMRLRLPTVTLAGEN
jgi:hypothetical protein